MNTLVQSFFGWIFFILVDNKTNHKSSDESSTNVTIASSLKKRSLMTIQNQVKRSLFTTQMNVV